MWVARVVWDGETAITDSHLALAEWKGEVAQLIEKTTQGLRRHGNEHI